MMRRFSLFVTALALLAVPVSGSWAAGGEPSAGALQPPSPVVTATGRATIFHGDIAGARERAVQAALVRALERYAGLRIESSTLIKKGELIDREVRAHTHGYIERFEVLNETREGDELAVTVRVHVADTPVKESFARMMSATTTLLLLDERSFGHPVEGQILPAVLADPFFTARVVVPPVEVLRNARNALAAKALRDPDPELVKEIALRHMAGIVVMGWADTEALDTGSGSLGYGVDPSVLRPVVAARGNLTVLDGRTGAVIAARRFDDVRASDAASAERASLRALTELAGKMRTFLVESLSDYIETLGYPLRVTVKGSAAADGAARIRQVLADTRWVRHVDLVSEAPGKTVLEAVCTERPAYVVEALRAAPELRIVRFDAAAGELSVR